MMTRTCDERLRALCYCKVGDICGYHDQRTREPEEQAEIVAIYDSHRHCEECRACHDGEGDLCPDCEAEAA
jgi:hypothetical protein